MIKPLLISFLVFSLLGCAHIEKKIDSAPPAISTSDLSNNIDKQKEFLKNAGDANDRLNKNLTEVERLSRRIDDKAVLLEEK